MVKFDYKVIAETLDGKIWIERLNFPALHHYYDETIHANPLTLAIYKILDYIDFDNCKTCIIETGNSNDSIVLNIPKLKNIDKNIVRPLFNKDAQLIRVEHSKFISDLYSLDVEKSITIMKKISKNDKSFKVNDDSIIGEYILKRKAMLLKHDLQKVTIDHEFTCMVMLESDEDIELMLCLEYGLEFVKSFKIKDCIDNRGFI